MAWLLYKARSGAGLAMAAMLAVLGFAITTARADVIPSSLNCPIVSGSVCASPTGSYGTITFSDAGNSVDIGISLVSGLTIQQIVLNYDQAKFNNSTPFTATIGATNVSVQNAENSVSLLGSGNFGGFDL